MTFTWPGLITDIWPPQAHVRRHVLVTAGTPPMLTLGDPGIQGPVVTGMQGCGVRTPDAAEVADATWGFEGVVHIPNGMTFAIGTMSATRATTWPPAWTGVPAGTATRLDGVVPNVHMSCAPFVTSSGMSSFPCSTGAGRAVNPR